MTNYLYAEVNVVGAMVLLLILTNQHRASFFRLPFDQQIFNGVMRVQTWRLFPERTPDPPAGTGKACPFSQRLPQKSNSVPSR